MLGNEVFFETHIFNEISAVQRGHKDSLVMPFYPVGKQKSHWRCLFHRRPHSLAHNPYPTYAREWGLLWNSHLQWDFRCSKRTQRHGQTSLWLSYPSPARLLNKQMEYRERVRREPDLYIPSNIKTIFIRSLLNTIAESDPVKDIAEQVFDWVTLPPPVFWTNRWSIEREWGENQIYISQVI